MKTVFFDLDDTLYSRFTPFQKAFHDFFPLGNALKADQAFRTTAARGDEVFQAHQDGKITSEQMYIYRYCRGFEDCGITISEKEALQFYERYQYQLDHLSLPPDTEEMLEVCRKLFAATGIITNGPGLHQRNKITALNLEKWIRPELIIISGETGYAKPDPRIFEKAAGTALKDPKDLIYVGDNYNNDILPALKAGWTAIYYNSAEKPDQLQAHNMSELIDMLTMLAD